MNLATMWKSAKGTTKLIQRDRRGTIDLNLVESSNKKPVKYYGFEWGVWQLLTLSSFIDMSMAISKQHKTLHGLMFQTAHSILVVLCFLHLIITDKHNDYTKLSNRILNWIDACLIAVYTLTAGVYLSFGFLNVYGNVQQVVITDKITNDTISIKLDDLGSFSADSNSIQSVMALMIKLFWVVKFLSREFMYKIYFILLRNYFIRALPSYGEVVVPETDGKRRSCCHEFLSSICNIILIAINASYICFLVQAFPDTRVDFFVSLAVIYLIYLYVYVYHGASQNEPNCSFIFAIHQCAAIIYFTSRFF